MENSCGSCLKPSATLECGCCKDPVCKKCANFVEADYFSFLGKIPAELSHQVYCHRCYEDKVAPEMLRYEDAMERARNFPVFFTTQSKETRLIKRKEQALTVQNCADRDETLLRLAFLAAQGGFNALIDVELTSKKIKDGTYQTQIWSGTGVPVQADPKRLK